MKILLPKLSQSRIQGIWNSARVEEILVSGKKLFVHSFCYHGAIHVAHRPSTRSSVILPLCKAGTDDTYHIVPITLLNPTKSIVAAKCTA